MMHFVRFCLVIWFSLLLIACGETTNHQAAQQVKNSTVAMAGRDATVVKGDQVIEQQTVVKTSQELINALIETQQQQRQSLSLFEKYTLWLGITFIFLIISLLLLKFIFSRLCVESARNAFIADLRTGLAQQQLYKRAVTSLLAGVERVYGNINQPLKAFNTSILLAFIYPILLFTFAYSFTGGTPFFSGTAIFPENSSYNIAYFPGLILSSSILLLIVPATNTMDLWAEAQLQRLLPITSGVASQIWSITIGICVACIFYFWIKNGSISWALFGLVLGYYSGVLGVICAVGVVGVVVGVVVGDLGGVGAGVVLGALLLVISVGGAVSAGIVLVIVGVGVVAEKYSLAILLLFFYLGMPFLNAFLDWISWWISRYLLAKTLQTNNPFYIALEVMADSVFAILCLLLLCILLPAGAIFLDNIASYFNWIDKSTQTLVQTGWQYHAYAAFADPRGEGLMVTAMLFSTLIPTLLHLVFACSAVIIHLLHGHKLADYLESASDGHQFRYAWASLWLYSYGVLALILVVAVIMGAIQLLHLPVGTWLYNFTYSIYSGYGMQAI